MRKFFLLVGLLIIISCKREKPKIGTPLAKVDDIVITEEAVRSLIPALASEYIEEESRSRLLNMGIETTLLYLYAKDKGIDEDPVIKDRIRWMERFLVADEFFRREVLSKINISTGDVEEFYNKYKDEFEKDVDLVYIAGRDSAKIVEFHNRIKRGASALKILSEIQENPDFIGDYAQGLNLGSLRISPSLPPELVNVVFDLKYGQVSEVVRLYPEGYGFVYIYDITKTGVSREDIYRAIKLYLSDAQAQAKKDSLLSVIKKKHPVEFFEPVTP